MLYAHYYTYLSIILQALFITIVFYPGGTPIATIKAPWHLQTITLKQKNPANCARPCHLCCNFSPSRTSPLLWIMWINLLTTPVWCSLLVDNFGDGVPPVSKVGEKSRLLATTLGLSSHYSDSCLNKKTGDSTSLSPGYLPCC